MPWGGGVFTRSNGTYSGADVWEDDEANGFDIVSSRHDTHDQDLAQGINACLNRAGQNAMTANLPMGGKKITGMADGSASSDAATVGQVPVEVALTQAAYDALSPPDSSTYYNIIG